MSSFSVISNKRLRVCLVLRFIITKWILCFFAPDSLVGNCFKHKSIFHGVNFPADGPVMKKETTGWDPSFEKMTVCNGSLKGDVTMFLLLKNGGYHRCHFNTTYK